MKRLLLFALFAASPLHAQEDLSAIVAPDAKVETLAQGYNFTEGAVWNPRGFWLFSDIPANTLSKITPDGKTEVIRNPTGNSNGNAYDAQVRLIACEHSGRRVSRKKADGTFETLADSFEGKKLNSPNDLAIHSDGSIYFTDPIYGVKEADRELDFRGLYRLFPNGKLELLDKEWEQPNGIALSPDESKLYVGDSQAGKIYVYPVDKTGKLGARTLFATIPKPGDPDGMKCDSDGRLYVTGPGGVWVYAPDGAFLGLIKVPKDPANLSFGGADGQTILLTARDTIYSLKLQTKGAQFKSAN